MGRHGKAASGRRGGTCGQSGGMDKIQNDLRAPSNPIETVFTHETA